MSCRLTFISMIFGMRGTTSQPPGASTRELMGRLGQVGCCLAAGPRTARTRRGVDRPLARVAGGRTSAVGTSSLAKRFPTD